MNTSKLEEIRKQAESLNEKIQELKKEAMEVMQKEFHNGMKVIFEEYPFIKQIHFTAYRPYWNDGESCEYRVHHDGCGINGCDGYGEESDVLSLFAFEPGEDVLQKSHPTIYEKVGNQWQNIPNPGYNPDYKKAVDDVREYLALFGDEQYEDMIGDHVMVMIDVDGIHVEEYSHG